MGLYLVDSTPRLFGRRLTSSLALAVGSPPGAGDRSSGTRRSRRRRCCGGSPAGSAGLCRVLLCLFQNLKVFPLVPTAIGCMAGLVPLRHCSRGCGGLRLVLVRLASPQSGGVSVALVAFISRKRRRPVLWHHGDFTSPSAQLRCSELSRRVDGSSTFGGHRAKCAAWLPAATGLP